MFTFPAHFKHPPEERIWFLDHQPNWDILLKDKFDKPIKLEDLMENKQIMLDDKHIGIYIPHAELIKRTKYNWFCSLSAEDVLKCKIFISNYMTSI